MTDTPRFSLARLFTILGALWLATGAFYKLIWGNPGDLPQPFFDMVDWFGIEASKSQLYVLAIASELCVVVLALLRPKLGWIPLAATFLFFEAILAPLIASGAESCGCLGGTIKIHPILMASIDGVILLGLFASRPWRAAGMQPVLPTVLVGALLAASIAAPIVKLSGNEPSADEVRKVLEGGDEGEGAPDVALPKFVELTPPDWIGQMIYDTPLATWLPNIDTMPTDGTFVFWRMTCDHCAEHLLELANEPPTEALVLIRIREEIDETQAPAVHVLPQGGHVFEYELTEKVEWVISTPADMKVEGATIVDARENIGH